ncbi:class I SAM-dependent methyltransferase [Flavisolibacter sp. BT320]|nr:class I SAM-dependent methyltransferase [Flavisolibacter longurius]
MYSSVQLARKFIHYYLYASNGKGHGMHSPFVFQFILHVLNNRSNYLPPVEIEVVRKQLLQDKRMLQIDDFGAGSRVAKTKQRTVSEAAGAALKSKKYAQLLYRLVKHYQPLTILELGTSLGITTSYFAAANPLANILTIEGSKAIADVAAENFSKLGCTNIKQRIGNFDDLLPDAIRQLSSIDLAYVDGNHRYSPTINYFNQLLPALHNNSILVFDDIHWSEEMEKAWEEIKQHPSVQCTVDVFFLGFVFFRKEFKVAQHFRVRF